MLLQGEGARAERACRSCPTHLLIILLLLPQNGVADAEIARRSSPQYSTMQLRGGRSSDMEESSSSSSSSESSRPMFVTPSWQAEAEAIKAKWRQKPPLSAVDGPLGVGEPRQVEENEGHAAAAQTRLTQASTPSNSRSPLAAIGIMRTPTAAAAAAATATTAATTTTAAATTTTTAAPSMEQSQQRDEGGDQDANSTVGDTSIGRHLQRQLPAEDGGRFQAVEGDNEGEGSGGGARTESGMPRLPPVDLDRIMSERIRMLGEIRDAEKEVMRLDLDVGRGGDWASNRDGRRGGEGGGGKHHRGDGKLSIVEQVCVWGLGFDVEGLGSRLRPQLNSIQPKP